MDCTAIANNECSSAIVAGTNLIMSPTMTIAMSEQGVLSPDATCKTTRRLTAMLAEKVCAFNFLLLMVSD
jgi:hypothetical protein